MTFVSLSSRGALIDAVNTDSLLTISDLMSKYRISEYAAKKIRKELTELGFIVTRRENQGGGFIMKRTYVTPEGYDYVAGLNIEPFDRQAIIRRRSITQLHKSIELTSQLVPNTSKNNSYKIPEKIREGEKMGYEFFKPASSEDDSDARAAKRLHEADRMEEYAQEKARVQKNKLVHRLDKQREDWTPSDVAAEFADRTKDVWGLPTWSVSQTKFVPSLKSARDRNATNGKIECEMIDMFFISVKGKRWDSGEQLWRTFLYRFQDLSVAAKKKLSTPEKLDRAKIQAEKSWKGL
jgi:flagellar biosynthesis GTPase FlhF